jgi:hypothetical protein
VVGRQALNELAGVARQLLALGVHADQVGQAQVEAYLQRLEETTAPLTVPTGGQALLPVDLAALGWQQWLEPRQNALGALEKNA